MNREFIWLLCPLWSALYLIGGWKQKNWRRLGIPLTLFATGLLCHTPLLPLVYSSLLLAVCLRLPFTLIGSRIDSSAWNWIWIWVLGYLLSIPSLILRLDLITPLLPLVVVGILGTLSNRSQSAKDFPWKFVEGAIGFSLAYPFCLALS
jgi:hypothetical protein